MQEVHPIRGGNPFTAGGGDRRIRHNNNSHVAATKCPRCDSSNTKFCYYNNYNLSQPRHFCKGCRRYWTKGGLLRNVPVGGGCRKPKRRPKVTPTAAVEKAKSSTSVSQSTSENSSTLTGVSTDTAARVESNGNDGGAWFERARLMDSGCGGIFNGLTNGAMSFGFSTHHHQERNQWLDERWPRQQKMDGGDGGFNLITAGLFDQTVQDELSGLQNRSTVNNGGGFGPLDWQGIGNNNCEQSVFDLTNTVDKAYCNWSQTQWSTINDQDYSSLHLP